MELLQIHLRGASNRLARLRVLTPAEHDAVFRKAGSLVGKDATMLDLRVVEAREGVKAMLAQVSRNPVAEPPASPTDASVEWESLSEEKLEMPGPYQYDKLFGAKDDAILTSLYRRYHEVKLDEIEAIAGKALTVSTD